MSAFDTLLEQLDAQSALLAKSLKQQEEGGDDDDAAIAAMADSDRDEDGIDDDEDEETGGPDEEEDEDDKDEPMAKSLRVTLANGEVLEAIDGTAMVKALSREQAALTSGVHEVMGQMMSLLKSMRETITEDKKQIGYLKKSLADLSRQGGGRRSVSSAPGGEQPAATADLDTAKDQIMAKAMAAYDAKKINAIELNSLDLALRDNRVPSETLLRKIA